MAYAFQELSDIPDFAGREKTVGRAKPWGTGHAVLACDGLLNSPFCVINADDYYGKEGFVKAARFLDQGQYGLVGYVLKNTLSDNGGVTRGIIKGNTYRQFDILIHPYSKIPLAGHVINRWKEIIKFVIKAHLRAPKGLRLIGWDVCVSDDDLSLIEGNGGPGFHCLFNPEEDQWKEVQGYLNWVCDNKNTKQEN